MYNHINIDYTFIKGENMYFKSFDKLSYRDKIEILSELNLMYDLTTEKGINALKKEFKYISCMIEKAMIEKGLRG